VFAHRRSRLWVLAMGMYEGLGNCGIMQPQRYTMHETDLDSIFGPEVSRSDTEIWVTMMEAADVDVP
jgi:hypothetical protein